CVLYAHCSGALDDSNTGCMGPPESFSFGVTYPHLSDAATLHCTVSGSGDVAEDGQWHPLAVAACLPAGATPTSWSGTAALDLPESGLTLESKLVADAAQPDGPIGPVLIARIPPKVDPCTQCLASGQTLAQCQAAGACPT